jgi:hypothetical protein
MPLVIACVVAVIRFLDPAKGDAVRLRDKPGAQKKPSVDINYSVAE